MDRNASQVDKNNAPNPSNQLQPTNDLSRFGHSVTLCKKFIIIIII
jgi:hypothetical protein